MKNDNESRGELIEKINRYEKKLNKQRKIIKVSNYITINFYFSIGTILLFWGFVTWGSGPLSRFDNIGNFFIKHYSSLLCLSEGLDWITLSIIMWSVNKDILNKNESGLSILYAVITGLSIPMIRFWGYSNLGSVILISVEIFSLSNLLLTAISATSKFLRNSIGESKDRLTISIALIGIFISLVALLK